MNFQQKLEGSTKKNNSLVCVGLDTDVSKIPKHFLSEEDPMFAFNKAIIDATHDLACVFKPNIAFYEAEGIKGLTTLKETIDYIKKKYSEIPIVLDAKRADIPNTAEMYAKACFEFWNVDAATVHPNLGLDSLMPFFAYKNRLTILLLKTSNSDSKMFQDLPVNGKPYYLALADEISKWRHDNIGIFVGSTYPNELKAIREIFPDKIFLSAGFGAQKGEIKEAVEAGVDAKGGGIMFNASRSILYVSDGKDFAEAARQTAKELRDQINKCR